MFSNSNRLATIIYGRPKFTDLSRVYILKELVFLQTYNKSGREEGRKKGKGGRKGEREAGREGRGGGDKEEEERGKRVGGQKKRCGMRESFGSRKK